MGLMLIPCFGMSTRNIELPPLQVQGTDIIATPGVPIILKGFNLTQSVWGRWEDGISEELRAQHKNPMIKPREQYSWAVTSRDIELIHSTGANVVRYAINYELFAPENPSRDKNLRKLQEDLHALNDKGIYMLVNLHCPPGLDVMNDLYELYKPGAKRMRSIFEDTDLWERTVAMWTFLAAALRNEPGVAGYELFNEPRIPCTAEGGLPGFKKKYEELCEKIRSVDPDHILFVPAYNSREADPGEQYGRLHTDEDGRPIKNLLGETSWITVQDTGEQGVIWEQNGVTVSATFKNIVYVFHMYEPTNFTIGGEWTSFAPAKVTDRITVIAQWSRDEAHAPVMITEYGVMRAQPEEKRLEYIRTLHAAFKTHGLSTTFFEYKSIVNAFTSLKDICGIWWQYVDIDREVDLAHGTLHEWTGQSPEYPRFKNDLRSYFWDNNRPVRGPVLTDPKMLKELREYFKARTAGSTLK